MAAISFELFKKHFSKSIDPESLRMDKSYQLFRAIEQRSSEHCLVDSFQFNGEAGWTGYHYLNFTRVSNFLDSLSLPRESHVSCATYLDEEKWFVVREI